MLSALSSPTPLDRTLSTRNAFAESPCVAVRQYA